MTASLTGILLGLLVGVRHAFEPDHLTAVSTLVTHARDGKRGALLGAIWGLGHTASLVVVGLVLMILGATLPAQIAAAFECGVAAMLVILGIRAIVHRNDHRNDEHAPDAVTHLHVGDRVVLWRPLFVGLIHGLAGSGALTAFVFAEQPTFAARVAYIALFGFGSVAGMAIASGIAGVSLQAVARTARIRRGLALATGAVSIVVGVLWGIPMVSVLVG